MMNQAQWSGIEEVVVSKTGMFPLLTNFVLKPQPCKASTILLILSMRLRTGEKDSQRHTAKK